MDRGVPTAQGAPVTQGVPMAQGVPAGAHPSHQLQPWTLHAPSVPAAPVRPSVRAAGNAATTGSIKPKCFLLQTIKSHRAAAPQCRGITLTAQARVPTCRPLGHDTRTPSTAQTANERAHPQGASRGSVPPGAAKQREGTAGGAVARPVSPRREQRRRSACSSATMSRCVNAGPASAGSPRPAGCGSACEQRAAPY